MKKWVLAICLILTLTCTLSCGVDKKDQNLLGTAPDLAGAWRIVLLPTAGDCAMDLKGFAIHSPLDVPYVTQDSYNLSASFDMDSATVTLSGDTILGYTVVVLEESGVFMETLGGTQQGPGLIGTFKGQELPTGCGENGVFAAAIGTYTTPSVTGEWTLTLSGTADTCLSPADDGTFEKIITNVAVVSTSEGVIGATYMDPLGTINAMGGIVLGDFLAAAITDISIPPGRSAFIVGTIDSTTNTITGTLSGKLAFPGGNCSISGGSFTAQY